MTIPQPNQKEVERLIAFHSKMIYDTVEYANLPNKLDQDEMESTVDRLRDLIHARRNFLEGSAK